MLPTATSEERLPAPADVYWTALLQRAPHVLSLMDREVFSPTRGCMDRTYWAWKFTDFPGARFQEGLCVLSFLLTTPAPGNPFFGQPKLLEWIAGGFDFWAGIQRAGGDFDEAYPYERSLAAAAFTSFYLAEAWRMLDGRLPADVDSRFKQALERTGDWLIRNDETHGFLSNHLAAAATALYHAYEICGAERFEARSRHFLGKILDHQSAEGWYEEYGGADPGYQTHGSYYLARYWQLSGHPDLVDSLDRSFRFLAHFIHPDGSLGGEYTSRNTQTYYPAAFEMMAGVSGPARWIAETQRPAVAHLSAAGLGTVDAYNLFPLINNYVFAYRACQAPGPRAAPEAPSAAEGLVHFPEAGLLKVRRQRYDLYVGLTKGGVIKAFDRRRRQLVYNDCGYLGRLKNGKWLASQWIEPARPIEVTPEAVVVGGGFYQIKKMVMTPFPFLGFRAFSLTVGRLRALSYWLKALLVKVLIYRKQALDLSFTRRITLADEGFVVEDRIQGSLGDRIDRLVWGDVFTTIHMGSARYFVPNDLTRWTGEGADQTSVDPAALADGVRLVRRVRFDKE